MSALDRETLWDTGDDGEDHASGRNLSKPLVYLLLGYAVVVLGLNWPVMATGLRSISPIWMAAFRAGGAALVVGVASAVTGNIVIPPRRDLPIVASVAAFRLATLMTLVFFALQLVPAGRASVLVWTTALWTVPIAAVFLGEKVTRRRWVGLLIGIAGVIAVSQVWENDWGNRDVVIGAGLLLLGSIVNASTAVHIRRHRWTIKPHQALPWQLVGATIPLTVLALIVEGVPNIDWTPQLVGILFYQAALATGTAFWAQIVVLRNLSAVSTNLTMMGVPIVGVVSSVIFLDERVTVALAIGMVLVFIGVSINVLTDREEQKDDKHEKLPTDEHRPLPTSDHDPTRSPN